MDPINYKSITLYLQQDAFFFSWDYALNYEVPLAAHLGKNKTAKRISASAVTSAKKYQGRREVRLPLFHCQ